MRTTETPEAPSHTSVKLRIKLARNVEQPNQLHQQPDALKTFAGNPGKDMPDGPLNLSDYLMLVDWTFVKRAFILAIFSSKPLIKS